MDKITLMYHDVYFSMPSESGFQSVGAMKYKLSFDDFEHQVKAIVNYCRCWKNHPLKVLFTFDDGGSSAYNVIAPLLELYGLRGYFFIATSYLNSKGFLTEAEVADLHRRGHVLGVHSHTHPYNLAACDWPIIEEEWRTSISTLEKILHQKIEYAALPGGSSSKRMIRFLSDCGITKLFTSDPISARRITSSLVLIGRYSVTHVMRPSQVLNLLRPISYQRLLLQVKWLCLLGFKKILGKNYVRTRAHLLLMMKKY